MISKLYAARLKSDLLRLAFLSLVTVFIWIGLTVYRSLNESDLSPDVKKQILPLTAIIDLDTMDLIKNRELITDVDWQSFQPTQEGSILTAPIEASGGAELSQPATVSGSLNL